VPAKKKKSVKKILKNKPVQTGPDSLTLALYLITFILLVFGSWYHKINWIMLSFIPFLVGLWYEYMRKHIK